MNHITSPTINHHKQFKNFIPKRYIDLLTASCQRFRIYDPVTTLFCMIQQSLNQSSYKQIVIDLNILRHRHGQKSISMNTAAFCKAKKRLPIELIKKIAIETGQNIEDQSAQWRWNGREVYNIDGTVFDCEDTQQIKKTYPAILNNGKQLGFPKIRLLGVFSMTTGTFLNGELGTYSGKGCSEVSLLKKILSNFKPKTILVMDRFFTSYFLQSLLIKNKLDYVIRARDEMAQKILKNKTETITTLKIPAKRKRNFWYNEYDEALTELSVKIIKSSVKRKGFRVAKIYIISSLVDVKKTEIEMLYSKRWSVELDIRNLKCTMNSKVLKAKSDRMAELELWTNLIAYNLIRKMMCHLAMNSAENTSPRKYSFKMVMQSYVNIVKTLGINKIGQLIEILKSEKLANAKYRREPRAIKRRNNKYPHLTATRKDSINEVWGYSRRTGSLNALYAMA